MEQALASYAILSTSIVSVVQKTGALSVPVIVAVGIAINYLGGDRAIRAVGITIATVAVLTLLLNNTVAVSRWIAAPAPVAVSVAATPVATPVAGQ